MNPMEFLHLEINFEILQKTWLNFGRVSILEELIWNELWDAFIYRGLDKS